MAEEKNKKTLQGSSLEKKAQQVDELSEAVLNVRRVAKVIKGGRRFGFSALVVVGDKSGRVGIALGKSREVSAAISKALKRARKSMFTVPLYKTTIPYAVEGRHGSSRVIIRSASKGTGIIAGGAVRAMLEALGVRDILAKAIGSSNSQNVAKATINALQKLKSAQDLAALRGKTLKDLFGDRNVTA